MSDSYESSVFLNVPFDGEYEPIQRALVFAVSDCGFSVRCALEIEDSSQSRFEKICTIMSDCQYGIHDISRVQLHHGLPRFNMPLELGERFRYQKFCSDIAGQDIRAHGGSPKKALMQVRDWLASALSRARVLAPGGETIARRHAQFLSEMPKACRVTKLNPRQLTYSDYLQLVWNWQEENRLKI